MPDQTLVCKDCSAEFAYTEGEQQFYNEKGFAAPVRCPECRRRRKAEKMSFSGGDNRRQRDW